MKAHSTKITQQLYENNYISKEQLEQINEYRNRGIFSLRFELRTFLYISILMFTSGVGILIYQNIDTIGHSIIIAIILLITGACFYFSFKNAQGFSKDESTFENPLFDYLVLAANMLFCVFIGYLQFQYQIFGTKYGLATLIPTLVALVSAYYFDNKSVLSIGITGLAAFWGLSVSPQSLWDSGNYSISNLSYTAIFLGVGLLAWNYYCGYIKLKTHFELVFLTFALHLIAIASITNLFEDYWYISAFFLAGIGYFSYKKSYQLESVSLMIFTVIYMYIGFNIFIYRLLDILNTIDIFISLAYIGPFYFIGSIVLFIQLIKKFRNKISHDSL